MYNQRRKRKFLERDADSYYSVTVDSDDETKNYGFRAIDLKLASCHDSIFLSFGYGNKREAKRMMKKWEVLNEAIQLVGDTLKEAQ